MDTGIFLLHGMKIIMRFKDNRNPPHFYVNMVNNMYYDVISVKYIEDYKLEVEFETGEKGIVDLSDYPKKGGVFSSFKDINYLKQFYIDEEWNVLCWPDNLDIAPEKIYSMATGKPISNSIEDNLKISH